MNAIDNAINAQEYVNFDESFIKSYSSNGHEYHRIYCDKKSLKYDPPQWMQRGLQETASGYGSRLNSGYKIQFEGKWYRIYVTIYSNNGSSWFRVKGRKIYVD